VSISSSQVISSSSCLTPVLLYYRAAFGASIKLSGILKYIDIKGDVPSLGL
jgi:hypothetical protein